MKPHDFSPRKPTGDGSWGRAEVECGNYIVEGDETCDPPGAFCAHEYVGEA